MIVKQLNVINEPKLIYTSKAFAKLIDYLNTKHAQIYEFGFIGLIDKRENNYIVTDVSLHPQICKQAFYETDDAKFPEWLNKTYTKPEERKMIRLQGHSHVNMATNPSGTDEKQILDLVNQVQDYYIQLIINQRLENTCNIYSKEQNLIYTNVSEYVIINDKVLVKIDKQLDIVNLQDCLTEPRISKDTLELTFSSGIKLKIDTKQPYYTVSDKYIKINTFNKKIDSLTKNDYDKEMNNMCKTSSYPYVSSYQISPNKYDYPYDDFDDEETLYKYGYDKYGNKLYDYPNTKSNKKGKK